MLSGSMLGVAPMDGAVDGTDRAGAHFRFALWVLESKSHISSGSQKNSYERQSFLFTYTVCFPAATLQPLLKSLASSSRGVLVSGFYSAGEKPHGSPVICPQGGHGLMDYTRPNSLR